MNHERPPKEPATESQLSELFGALQGKLFDAGLAFERYLSRLVPRTVEFGGESWSYLERPGTGPALVLVHGFTGSKDNWLTYVRHLPPRLRVIVPDLMGHGGNAPRIDREYGGWAMTDALHGMLGAIGCDTFHLAGHSLGGLLAAGFATKFPSQVLSLFLVCPAGIHTDQTSEFFQLIDEGNNPFLCSTRAEYDRVMQLVFHGKTPIPGIARTILCRELIERRSVFAKVWMDLNAGGEDVVPLLEGVRAPTRIVWGKFDRVLHPSCLQVFARHIPRADSAWLECGHCPPVECPAELAHAHLDKLTGVPD